VLSALKTHWTQIIKSSLQLQSLVQV